MVDGSVVVWNNPAARTNGLKGAGKVTNDGGAGLIAIAVTIAPSHVAGGTSTLGSLRTIARMARRFAGEWSPDAWRVSMTFVQGRSLSSIRGPTRLTGASRVIEPTEDSVFTYIEAGSAPAHIVGITAGSIFRSCDSICEEAGVRSE